MSVKVDLESGIGTLTLAHPPLNILTRAVLADLRARLAELAAVEDLRVLLLLAEGKHFSAGADVGEHLPPEHEELIPEFLETIVAVATFPVPVIAAVRGRCLGGGFELVQAADIVIAGEGAQLGQPEILLGVTAPAACLLLPLRTRHAVASEILFTGDPIAADRAAAAGLVLRVVPDAGVEEEARRLAGRMARHSAVALRATKKTLLLGAAGSTGELAGSAVRIYVEELMRSDDALEGLRSFLEKRTPTWTHR